MIVTHGGCGECLLAAAAGHRRARSRRRRRSACGERSRSTTSSRASAGLRRGRFGRGVLILVDVHGSSPFRACLAMVDGTRPVEIVCGVNLPMLIKLATCDRRGHAPGRGGRADQGGRQALDPPRLGADRQVLRSHAKIATDDGARRTRRADPQPAGHARAGGGEVRPDRQQVQLRGQGGQGRPGGQRQEHHGPADAGGRARRDHDRRRATATTRRPRSRRWPSWSDTGFGEGVDP